MTAADDFAEALAAEAETDEDLVRLAARHLTHQAEVTAAIETVRDTAAMRLRDRGVPMVRIAVLARVSDSYLARRLFRLGAARKVIRD